MKHKNANRGCPTLVKSKYECCGCTACYATCPTGAINMFADDEGFLYPTIDNTICISCNKCVSMCQFKKDKNELLTTEHLSNCKEGTLTNPITYAVKIKNLKTRMMSRSGGFFVAISDVVLSKAGVVYGCVLDDNLSVVHMRASTSDARDRMQGSKYVQSNLQNVFSEVKRDLEDGKLVLFSGTSCQIAGLKASIPTKLAENLVTVDIVCHGVPSPKVYSDYLRWQEMRQKSKCINIDFRNKRLFGWDSHIETLYFTSGKMKNSKVYTRLFYSHNTLRPSCYQCPYKRITHPSDITIADYWGVKKAAPGFNDNKGVSLVLVNSAKGMSYFKSTEEAIEYRKTDIEDSLQPPLMAPFPEPDSREAFWKDYKSSDFQKIAEIYSRYGKKYIIRNAIAFCRDYLKGLIVRHTLRGVK